MQIQQTLSRLDDLLHQCRLDEAETLLTQAVAQAQAEADTDSEKLLRNEQIGFYRDCGKFPAALETAAAARALFEQTGETDTISYATTLLNCANAYRAAGNYEDAFAAYETVQSLYARLLPPDDGRVASLWNNLALLYQETEQWEQACTCLKQALELVQHDPDPTRTGISAANLAVSLLRLHRTAEALCYLQQAKKNFDLAKRLRIFTSVPCMPASGTRTISWGNTSRLPMPTKKPCRRSSCTWGGTISTRSCRKI